MADAEATPNLDAQDSVPAGSDAVGKPPLPGRPRRGRAAKAEEGMARRAACTKSSYGGAIRLSFIRHRRKAKMISATDVASCHACPHGGLLGASALQGCVALA